MLTGDFELTCPRCGTRIHVPYIHPFRAPLPGMEDEATALALTEALLSHHGGSTGEERKELNVWYKKVYGCDYSPLELAGGGGHD